MALITINGVVVPTPSEFSVSVYDISKAERNANGNMIIERVTTKKKLSLTYAFLTAGNASIVLNAIAPTTYDVTYVDPIDNTTKTAKFYCGDRNIGMIDYQNNVPRYKDLGFDLIEI